jgi:hypothetical protein
MASLPARRQWRRHPERAPGVAMPAGRPPRLAPGISRVARNRLAQFLVLGGLIFALAPRPDPRRDIVLDARTLAALEQAQAQRLGAPVLSPAEAAEVRNRAVEDEILYREALRLGFDRDDGVVRQRLIQKVLFLAEDLGGVSAAPTDEELRAFFEATRAQWTRPGHVRLIHVYAAPSRRDALIALRPAVVAAEAAAPGEPPALGDAFPLPRVVDASSDTVTAEYGSDFSAAVLGLAPGEWTPEPVRSKHGWHLVKVIAREDPGPATFEDVRAKLPLLYLVARKKEAVAEYLRQAASRYRITVDGRPPDRLPPSDRVAPTRSEGVD